MAALICPVCINFILVLEVLIYLYIFRETLPMKQDWAPLPPLYSDTVNVEIFSPFAHKQKKCLYQRRLSAFCFCPQTPRPTRQYVTFGHWGLKGFVQDKPFAHSIQHTFVNAAATSQSAQCIVDFPLQIHTLTQLTANIVAGSQSEADCSD